MRQIRQSAPLGAWEARMRAFVTSAIVSLLLASGAHATSGQLALGSQILSPVFLGYQDPLNALIYNTAPTGSDPVNYSVYATFPYGNTGTDYGTKAADGGTGYITDPFLFDTSQVAAGIYAVSVTATDTDTNGSLTQSG